MRTKIVFGVAMLTISSPAYAGIAAPTPEAGAGLAALALLGAGYAYMRRKTHKR